jgi:ankyrin repeat protein
VELLLDVGGDTLLDLGDHNADTPLHLCARQGHHQIAQLLLQVRDNRDVLDTHTHRDMRNMRNTGTPLSHRRTGLL